MSKVDIRSTALSIVLSIGRSLIPATLYSDGSFRSLAHGTVVYGVTDATPVMSQRKMVNGLKHAGTANFRAGAFAVDTIRRAPDGTLKAMLTASAADTFTVVRDVSRKDRKALWQSIVEFYGLEDVAQAA